MPGPIVVVSVIVLDVAALGRRRASRGRSPRARSRSSRAARARRSSSCRSRRGRSRRGRCGTRACRAFASRDGLADVERDRAGLRVRHQAARAEHAAELADVAHLIRRRDRDVEVGEAALDLRGEIGRADDVGAGLLGLASPCRPRRRRRRGRPCRCRAGASACRGAAGRRGGRSGPGGSAPRPSRRTSRPAAPSGARPPRAASRASRGRSRARAVRVALAVRAHQRSTSTPIERAVPAMTSIAWSTSRAFRSCELRLGDRAQLRLRESCRPCSGSARPSPSRARAPP